MKKILASLMAVLSLAACSSKKTAEEAPAEPKTLILCYSQTGTTLKLANELLAQLPYADLDLETIDAAEPYDGDFQATVERGKKEMEAGATPALNPLKSNIADYDQIFLCFPVWFGTYAQPIVTLLKEHDFEGKKVIVCCTFGSGGLQSCTEAVRTALPKAEVIEGFGIRTARIDKAADELNRFLIEHGFKQGSVEALPAFMEHHPVDDAEKAIFDEACADYQFPLGTPVSVAGRETANSTDYEFTAESTDRDGNATTATILVTKGKEEGAKAEFTQVIR